MEKKKKNFTGGIEGLINPQPVQKEESPTVNNDQKIVRANFLMKAGYHKKLKIIAAKESVDLKEALAEALDDFFVKKADLL